MTRMVLVDERPARLPYRAFFDDYVAKKEPVVLKGASSGWPARNRWSPQFLASEYGNEPVELAEAGSARRVTSTVGGYLSLPHDKQPLWYLVDWDFRRKCPGLLKDISIPPHFTFDWLSEVPTRRRPDLLWIYLGYAGTAGPTHIDNLGTSAWLSVVHGVKRVRFPTPRPGVGSLSKVDLFGEACGDSIEVMSEAIIDEGDVLYVPAGRWHAARNETYCLSVTANFVDGANFADHRAFMTRLWDGPRMLDGQLSRLEAAESSPERERLALHLASAFDAYRTGLDEESEHLATLEKRLKQATVIQP